MSTEQAIITDTDISSFEFKNGKLHLAAAVNIDENADVTSPAKLITVSVAGGKFTSEFAYTFIPGFVAPELANTNTNTAVTSGNDGVIGLFDASLSPGNSLSDVTNLSAINKFGVLDLDGSSYFLRSEEEFAFVASGSGGIQIIKINKIASSTDISYEGLSTYSVNVNLIINGNEPYSGSTVLKNVNIEGNFLNCGSLAIKQNMNVNGNGVMKVNGLFVFGQNKKNTSLIVNSES